jgi:hypothetical protein
MEFDNDEVLDLPDDEGFEDDPVYQMNMQVTYRPSIVFRPLNADIFPWLGTSVVFLPGMRG